MTAAARTQVAVRTVADTDIPLTIATHEGTQAIIAPLLPAGVTFDQVAAQVRLALAKDKDGALKRCTVGSVVLAVAKICGWGLEVGVTAHLVPFGDQCTALRDYTGDIQLAIEAGMVRHVESYVVYANEPFKITRGTSPLIEHLPIATPKERGAMIGVYALVYLRGGHVVVEYMTTEEVDAIRQAHSKQWKSGAVPRWYMKKTVIRQGLKLLPKTPKMRAILAQLESELEPGGAGALDERLADETAIPYRLGAGDVDDSAGAAGPGMPQPDAPALVADGAVGYEETSGELPLTGERTAPTRRRDALKEG